MVQIQKLLSSTKEESELTMCTDVDRNDKSRICEPGSVRVLGRRQIELYSRLIHTVDHVEGNSHVYTVLFFSQAVNNNQIFAMLLGLLSFLPTKFIYWRSSTFSSLSFF